MGRLGNEASLNYKKTFCQRKRRSRLETKNCLHFKLLKTLVISTFSFCSFEKKCSVRVQECGSEAVTEKCY